ncbi:MAG: hypothetical protein DHS20C15_10870 [Planctomycetota bacterium]|nr:MAG: hypothetical protein DHS20C15_10870 [Planctomycetota bacterium]
MSSQLPPAVSQPVRRRLDQVVGRIRVLRFTSGSARFVMRSVLALGGLYFADRLLHLPVIVRGVLLVLLAVFVLRELWLRVLAPQLRAPDRLDAARVVESVRPDIEGRLVSALQIEGGRAGSLESKVHGEAEQLCAGLDLRAVLTARPSLHELLRALGVAAAALLFVLLAQPPLEIFVQRMLLKNVAWPRDTVLSIEMASRSAVHVYSADTGVVAARGGVLHVSAGWEGLRPERPELVVLGADGSRSASMVRGADGLLTGNFVAQPGDTELFVRGGDDPGDATRLDLRVIEPPTLDDPRFRLTPPDYLRAASGADALPEVVGSEGLVVSEGTRVEVFGAPSTQATAAELRLLGEGLSVPLELSTDANGQQLRGSFTAWKSDSLTLVLTGDEDLESPEPAVHGLLVREDRPPTLRLYAPTRSDVKLTARAVVPIAVVAEDDHGVQRVELQMQLADGVLRETLRPDAQRPSQHRFVLDLAQRDFSGTLEYSLEAEDGRQLGERGPQLARLEGRRLDIVEDSEVQRLLSERQLRLKEAYSALGDRQDRASAELDVLLAEQDAWADSDLVAAGVAQGQVGNRLDREARELCAILEETLLNRLDPGPTAELVLQQRLADRAARPVDEIFAAQPWRDLADAYTGGRFGRLDVAGRLLDMVALGLKLSDELAPAASAALADARVQPSLESLQVAAAAQRALSETLDQLIDRMDEWEDYQEVLNLLKSLIDDQRSLRTRTQGVLTDDGRRN